MYKSLSSAALAFSVIKAIGAAAPFQCPQSTKEWAAFRNQLAFDLQTKQSATFLGQRSRCFTDGAAFVRQDSQLEKCLAQVQKELDRQIFVQPVSQKLISKGKSYLSQGVSKASVPPELQDVGLLRALAEGKISVVESYLDTLNKKRAQSKLKPLTFLRFKANAESTTGDPSDQRFLVYVPGTESQKIERWLSYTIPGEKDPLAPLKQLSVVAVETDSSGKTKTYYSDHHRETVSGALKVVPPHRVQPPPNADAYYCIGCHLSGGPLAIHPTQPVEEKYAAALASINHRIGQIGLSFSEHFDPRTAQVGMNLQPSTLPDEVLLGCYADKGAITENSLARLRSAMNCLECHDGEARARIQAKSSSMAAETMNQWWIHSGGMPPDIEPKLSKEEREALVKCLSLYQVQGNPKAGLHYQQLVSLSCEGSLTVPVGKPQANPVHPKSEVIPE